jgi:hypothetical protein
MPFNRAKDRVEDGGTCNGNCPGEIWQVYRKVILPQQVKPVSKRDAGQGAWSGGNQKPFAPGEPALRWTRMRNRHFVVAA